MPKKLQAQTKHADRIILPSSSQKYLRMYFEYVGTEKQTNEKRRISSSSFSSFPYQTLDQHSFQTKAVIELLHAQNDITFIVVAPFSPFVFKLARVVVLASFSSSHNTISSSKRKVKVRTWVHEKGVVLVCDCNGIMMFNRAVLHLCLFLNSSGLPSSPVTGPLETLHPTSVTTPAGLGLSLYSIQYTQTCWDYVPAGSTIYWVIFCKGLILHFWRIETKLCNPSLVLVSYSLQTTYHTLKICYREVGSIKLYMQAQGNVSYLILFWHILKNTFLLIWQNKPSRQVKCYSNLLLISRNKIVMYIFMVPSFRRPKGTPARATPIPLYMASISTHALPFLPS